MKKIAAGLIIFIFLFPLVGEAHSPDETYIKIVKPKNGIYLMDRRIIPMVGQVVIGGVTVMADASEDITGVEFMLPQRWDADLWLYTMTPHLPIPFTGISPLMD